MSKNAAQKTIAELYSLGIRKTEMMEAAKASNVTVWKWTNAHAEPTEEQLAKLTALLEKAQSKAEKVAAKGAKASPPRAAKASPPKASPPKAPKASPPKAATIQVALPAPAPVKGGKRRLLIQDIPETPKADPRQAELAIDAPKAAKPPTVRKGKSVASGHDAKLTKAEAKDVAAGEQLRGHLIELATTLGELARVVANMSAK